MSQRYITNCSGTNIFGSYFLHVFNIHQKKKKESYTALISPAQDHYCVYVEVQISVVKTALITAMEQALAEIQTLGNSPGPTANR